MLHHPENRVVAVLPGQGYRATYKLDDGSTATETILGWLVWEDGTVHAVVSDGCGSVETLNRVRNLASVDALDEVRA